MHGLCLSFVLLGGDASLRSDKNRLYDVRSSGHSNRTQRSCSMLTQASRFGIMAMFEVAVKTVRMILWLQVSLSVISNHAHEEICIQAGYYSSGYLTPNIYLHDPLYSHTLFHGSFDPYPTLSPMRPLRPRFQCNSKHC